METLHETKDKALEFRSDTWSAIKSHLCSCEGDDAPPGLVDEWDAYTAAEDDMHRRALLMRHMIGRGERLHHLWQTEVVDATKTAWHRWNKAFKIGWDLSSMKLKTPEVVAAMMEANHIANFWDVRWRDCLALLHPYRNRFIEDRVGEFERVLIQCESGEPPKDLSVILEQATGTKDSCYALFGVSHDLHKRMMRVVRAFEDLDGPRVELEPKPSVSSMIATLKAMSEEIIRLPEGELE